MHIFSQIAEALAVTVDFCSIFGLIKLTSNLINVASPEALIQVALRPHFEPTFGIATILENLERVH